MSECCDSGCWFGGLSAAGLLAKNGLQVEVVEKVEQPGGRASTYSEAEFNFDMGPSWYLMPDVYENYYKEFGKRPSDFFDLKRLDPSYRIFFDGGRTVDISADLEKNFQLFDTLEKDGGEKLRRYLESSREKYELAVKELLYKDYTRLRDFLDRRLMSQGRKMSIFENLESFVNKHFTSDEAKKIVEYSIGFLGGAPQNTPAFYHIMSHIDFNLGVWYPEGGMRKVVATMHELAESYGATFSFEEPVTRIAVESGMAKGVVTERRTVPSDVVLVNADYAHSELKLLESKYATYPAKYWEKRVLAPSAFVAYVGIDRKIDSLAHHNLFLDKDWAHSFDQIFDRSKAVWPTSPSYYVNVPSKTDTTAAPRGMESLFVLAPLAPGLKDTPELREAFYNKIMNHLESKLGEKLREHTVVKRIFALNDFAQRYNAYKGTALGLSHTLRQTALFRPAHRSKKVENLFYTGQYTHPGIGVPMTLISSQVVAERIQDYLRGS